MYLAIDVGGSKTLMAVFNHSGEIVEKYKFPTNHNYEKFLNDLSDGLAHFGHHHFSAVCCALPGQLDRAKGIALQFGNLPWKKIHIKNDVEHLAGQAVVLIENDAKLAGLSEALNHKQYKKVLYLTVSTGIGDGIIIDGKIDPYFANSEPGQMVMEFGGKLQKWEDFASGRALVARYGKLASEIDEPKIWQEFSVGLARGIIELAATLQPDVIIIGGGVGAHYEKFDRFLKAELSKLENAMVKVPPIIKAKNAEEAVIYGCYHFIKQNV